jgi:hypothetical protein
MCPPLNLYECCTKVKASPSARLIYPLVVTRTASVAERTIILMPFIRPRMDSEVGNTIPIKIEVCIFYDSMIDIEQFFT